MSNDITGFCKAGGKNSLHISLLQNIAKEEANVFLIINDENCGPVVQGVRFEGGMGTINYMISITHRLFRSIILPNSFIFFKKFNPGTISA